jgi:hypothetical protein
MQRDRSRSPPRWREGLRRQARPGRDHQPSSRGAQRPRRPGSGRAADEEGHSSRGCRRWSPSQPPAWCAQGAGRKGHGGLPLRRHVSPRARSGRPRGPAAVAWWRQRPTAAAAFTMPALRVSGSRVHRGGGSRWCVPRQIPPEIGGRQPRVIICPPAPSSWCPPGRQGHRSSAALAAGPAPPACGVAIDVPGWCCSTGWPGAAASRAGAGSAAPIERDAEGLRAVPSEGRAGKPGVPPGPTGRLTEGPPVTSIRSHGLL